MASVRPGDVLAGKYRVERVLGQGGMGYVVAARHLQLDQLVAMKFLRHGALEEGEATTRFLREAKASVKLKNEHIARVFDVGTLDGGEPYMVMEYLEGVDLAGMLKQPGRARLSVGEAVEYVIQACEALAEAHSLGIIHRDIKLANIFVTRGPAGGPLVKVLDFGISKTNPFGESEHDMTRTTSMLGSPRFMSPEQMRDPRAVDPRSDVWSLGVVLYRLVCGRPPFEAETLGALLSKVMHEYPDLPSVAAPDLPPGFDPVVMRCLEKDPAARYANVAELAFAMSAFAIEPMRARAAAERIAATLSVTAYPRSGEITHPSLSSIRNSAPPQLVDTGTAAPWAGTHGGGSRPSRSPIVWAAVGLVACLAFAGIFAKVRHDHDVAAAAAQAQADMRAQPNVAPMPPPEVPPEIAGAAPPPTSAPAAPPTMLAPTVIAPPPAPSPPPSLARAEEKPGRRPPAAPAPRGGKSSAPPIRPAAPSRDDGIPSTRD